MSKNNEINNSNLNSQKIEDLFLIYKEQKEKNKKN